tara:strand:+ start:186 stop:527 length:342 start_codon:yes stop_codon:yes gene_type:complete
MANVERLTKRVKSIEKWIEENDDMGGPKGLLETMSFLINEARNNAMNAQQMQQQFGQFRELVFEFLKEKEMIKDWDSYLEEKENALQEQETESVPVRDEPETSEGVRKEDAEE